MTLAKSKKTSASSYDGDEQALDLIRSILSSDADGRSVGLLKLNETAGHLSLGKELTVHEILSHGIPLDYAKARDYLMSALVENDVIPRRTWGSVLKREDAVLPAGMGEKLQRTERIEALAKEALGEDVAFDWLCEENSKFNGQKPIELMKFDAGARAVEIYLGQVMHGFNA